MTRNTSTGINSVSTEELRRVDGGIPGVQITKTASGNFTIDVTPHGKDIIQSIWQSRAVAQLLKTPGPFKP